MDKVKAQIEELLYTNASDFEIAKVLKEDIKAYFDTLEETFATSGGKDFLVKHTKKIDKILQIIYKVALREMFGDYAPMRNSVPMAMVALGSYGREQLCVYSDIDLMLVYKDVPGYNMKKMIEKMLYILWDTGLHLGHRVHEVSELFEVSRTDITIKTALIESRFIVGSNFIWTEVQNALTQIRYDNPQKFIQEKLDEQAKKHKKFPLTMEPNLKEGIGGFRDANIVFWIGKVLYNTHNIKHIPFEIVTEKDYRNFRMALEFLFRVRSALHLATGKKEDTLRLDLIPEVSRYLGYGMAKEEHMKFAKKVIGSLKVIRLYTIIWIDILSASHILPTPMLYCIEPNNQLLDFNDLLSQLIDNANNPFVPHPTFLQKLINAPKPEELSPEMYANISRLFYQEHAYAVLDTLSYAKLLKYLIIPIAKVIDLPQFDGYHQYAVDIHSLKCLQHLENIQDPYILSLYTALPAPSRMMLKIVTFLHDAGKGRSRDHHLVGATLFNTFANNLGMDKTLIQQGKTLILYHTLMSNVAQREDLLNEKVILKFASHFKSKELLDLIYILTYADMQGVGNAVYSDYTASLIRTLYRQSIESIKHKKILSETGKRVKKEMILKRNPHFISLPRKLQNKILKIPSNLLFLKYDSNKIIEIAQNALKTENYTFILSNTHFLSIEILRKDILNLGYLLAKLSNLEVVNMDISKLFGNYKYFKIDFSETVTPEDILRIEQIIHDAFVIQERGILSTPKIKSSEIRIDTEHSKTFAALYLNTLNQKGLLAFVIDIFDAEGLDIASAKIHTIKNRTRDIFLIEKNGNFCHNTQLITKRLTNKDFR